MSSGVFRWSCGKCGRPNEVEVAGRNPDSPVNCKWPPCKASKRIPKRMFEGGAAAPSARKAVPRVPARRVSSAPRRPEPEVEAWRPSPEDTATLAESVVQMGRMVRRRHRDEVAELEPTAVIDPDRAPAVNPDGVGRRERLPVADRARQALARRVRSAPYVDPLQPQWVKPCAVCAAEGRRTASGHWPAAAFAIELANGAAGLVCAGHLTMARKLGHVLVSVHPLAQPKPPRNGQDRVVTRPHPRLVEVSGGRGLPAVWSVRTDFAPLPAAAPNPVVEVSGDYAGRLVASLSSAAVSQRSSRRRRSLPA